MTAVVTSCVCSADARVIGARTDASGATSLEQTWNGARVLASQADPTRSVRVSTALALSPQGTVPAQWRDSSNRSSLTELDAWSADPSGPP
jgi:hypothetical protein